MAEKSSVWETQDELTSIPRSHGEFIKIHRCTKKGRVFADIRTYWTDAAGDVNPSGKGIAIPMEYLPQVMESLQANFMAQATGGAAK